PMTGSLPMRATRVPCTVRYLVLIFEHTAQILAQVPSMPPTGNLTRREQQVMDAIYELGEATAKEVRARLADPPSYSAVRAVLARLVDQGHLKFREAGPRYVYSPALGPKRLRQAALRKVVD